MRWAAGIGFALLLVPAAVLADGKRDLEDGIAFYDNLDIDRARTRLASASVAEDLSSADRARAFLYLGMLDFELGDTAAADDAFEKALRLDRGVKPPPGTSPKTKDALARVAKTIDAEEPGGAKPPPPAETPPGGPAVAPPPTPPPGLTAGMAPPPDDDEGVSPWVWVGVGAGVVAAATVAAIVVFGGSSSDCERGEGGCLLVTFQ